MEGTRLHILVCVICLSTYWITKVEGCHGGVADFGKREEENKETLRAFMTACMEEEAIEDQREITINWAGPVDYSVLHTDWFDVTSTTTCTQDTVECWLQAANSLVSANSSIVEDLKECIVQYGNATLGELYEGDRFDGDLVDLPTEDDFCPNVDRNTYRNDLIATFNPSVILSGDMTLIMLDDVLDVVENDFICPTCSCLGLSENAGTLVEYEFSTGESEDSCGRCWSTRVASMTRRSSTLASPFSLESIQRANLQRNVTECDDLDLNVTDIDNVMTATDLMVECREDSIKVTLDRCALVLLEIDILEDFVIANAEGEIDDGLIMGDCIPFFENSLTGRNIVYNIRQEFANCGAQITENNTHIHYLYTIRSRELYNLDDSIVDFPTDISVQFSCTYERDYEVSFSGGVEPLVRSLVLDLGDAPGNYEVRLTLAEDENLMDVFVSPPTPTVYVPDEIFVGVEIITQQEDIAIDVRRCWATNSTNDTNPLMYILIDMRCPVEPHVFILGGPSIRRTRFVFSSFVWTAYFDSFIYIHCEVAVCTTVASAGCGVPPVCGAGGKRKKREVDKFKYHNIEIGPIKAVERQSCSVNNGKCSHICSQMTKEEVECRCPRDWEMTSDRRTCIFVPKIEQHMSASRDFIEPASTTVNDNTSALVYFIILCLCCIVIWLLVERRRSKISNPVKRLNVKNAETVP